MLDIYQMECFLSNKNKLSEDYLRCFEFKEEGMLRTF